MTLLGYESEQACVDRFGPPSTRQDVALPRFHLKKRTISGERERIVLPSVNSAFLSGLFADVARVQEDSTVSESSSLPKTIEQDFDPREDSSMPCKKTRLTKTKSMTRCGKSFKLLSEVDSYIATSESSTEFSLVFPSAVTPIKSRTREDSLHFQLDCISSSSSFHYVAPSRGVLNAGKLAFPHLPTSSESANPTSTSLPRKVSDLQVHVSDETQPKESYGWFVEMDDDDHNFGVKDPYITPTNDLAFSAATAPKAANFDAEVEWARAADTVDDVLGDFF